MLLTLLLFLYSFIDPPTTYDGRAGKLAVRVPRVEVEPVIDGKLDEEVWGQAAVLTGFSQFSPTDGVPAADSTEVLVWYSPTAILFGIRAFEAHGSVHATLADRDRIASDDHVQILLSTFNDGRQATVFAVNPFGVQSDGALVETGSTSGNGFNNAVVKRETADLSPDFVFQSKGRLTGYGYEVEVRIPFKSIRFQPRQEQSWGINVVRLVQHSGHEDSWAPAKRASASFLAQSGRLVGLSDLRRGMVLDFTPSLTSRTTGAPGAGGWDYAGGGPELGGTVRWGVTNNLTLNGTANPDFSQVESDAQQVSFDPRQEIFFSEKRPFFLDGIEQFTTPSQLIYTRRIIQPVAAAKLTGKAFGTDLALLTAVDDRIGSITGTDHPIYNLLRVQRDIGSQSRLGLVYTDKIDGDNYNRVAGADARLVFGEVYSAQLQLAGSRTRTAGSTTSAPLWGARFARNGRTFGLRYTLTGIDESFRTRSGFISRPGIVHSNLNHRVTVYGKPKSLIESFTGDISLDGTWEYRRFVNGRGIQDQKLHFNTNTTLQGGWKVGASLLVESFGYPSDLYADYAVEIPRAGGAGLDTVAFTGTPTIPNLDYVLSLDTPEFAHFSGNIFFLWGHDENFYEWATADISWLDLTLDWRPTNKLRVNGLYRLQYVGRRTDGTTVNIWRSPRLKIEYQLSRPIFLRLVGEYTTERRDALRDDTRTGAPILIYDSEAGAYVRITPFGRRSFRGDFLFSYQPNPGTVLFAGYGSTMRDPTVLGRADLQRAEDGFFLKLSYLFQL
ncbi:MAG: carbohydrate binding family 9 domain-containing protein [Gemmatimonadales bacterium]|nr:carbohydrate binding family 9 domain-containing protein [Gemmatimonadales bacterium]